MNPSNAEPKQGRLFSCQFNPVRNAPDFPLVARAGSFYVGNHCRKSWSASKGYEKGTR